MRSAVSMSMLPLAWVAFPSARRHVQLWLGVRTEETAGGERLLSAAGGWS